MRTTVSLVATSIASLDVLELDRLSQRLPLNERQRASELAGSARARFVVGRLLARRLVSGHASVHPAAVVLDVDPRGRPVVVGVPLFVSIAHGGGYVMAAAASRPIGVDVEELTGAARHAGLERRVCSDRELRRLERIGDVAARRRGFMSIWTRKEAYGKALGVGLDFTLRAVTVGPKGSRIRGGPGVWSVRDVDLDAGYAAAVVARGRRWRVAASVLELCDL
jgi:4'-phosphopantetheinyl transferase